MQQGNLYLIPTTIGDNLPLEVLPISVKLIVEKIKIYIVENEKNARRSIKLLCPNKSQKDLIFYTINKYTDSNELPGYLNDCAKGEDIGVMSDAGCPAIADPGSEIVKIAHQKNIRIIPLVGPSSILMAMMSSGLNGQNFAFNGYLPIDKTEKKKRIKLLERTSFEKKQAQIFIETPYRNEKMLADLCQILHPETQLCVASNISTSQEYIKSQIVALWKKSKIELHKKPTIFIIQKD